MQRQFAHCRHSPLATRERVIGAPGLAPITGPDRLLFAATAATGQDCRLARRSVLPSRPIRCTLLPYGASR